MRTRVGGLLAAMAVLVLTSPTASAGPSFSVKLFAHVPAPGHPFGIAVDGDRVVVSTSAGQPLPWSANTQGERVFTFDSDGKVVRTVRVDTGPVSFMGLGGVALDGRGRLYVADMNGLVRRYDRRGTESTYASAPSPYSAGMYFTSMWNDIVFDPGGNAYVGDVQGKIWRITPDGASSIWFEDPRLAGAAVYQEKIDADGKYLYFAEVISVYPDRLGAGSIYRLPLKAHPAVEDLVEIQRFGPEPDDLSPERIPERGPFGGAETNGITIGRSGRFYVTESSRNLIAILSPSGRLIKEISSPLFHWPQYLTFFGDKLLVTNLDERADAGPEGSAVLSVDVGDTGVPPFPPRNITR